MLQDWGSGLKGILEPIQLFRGSAFWAWVVSVGVHLIIFTVSGVVRFSKAQVSDEQLFAPTGKILSTARTMRPAPVMPKPKISEGPVVIARNRYARMGEQPLPLERIFGATRPFFQDWHEDNALTNSVWPADGEFPGRVEFFGGFGVHRKVCYVVDCSGSMQGLFRQVRKKLKESIDSLQPDQYFYVIFFGDGRLYEVGDGMLLRATAKAKAAACAFIDSIRPAGKTNAAAALERLVQIQDVKGTRPSMVYFLTDGFELTGEDTEAFVQRTTDLLGRYAPGMIINTIAFLPQAKDRAMLEAVARQSGGEFVCVGVDR